MENLFIFIPPGLGISKDFLLKKAKKHGHYTQEMQLRFALAYINEMKIQQKLTHT